MILGVDNIQPQGQTYPKDKRKVAVWVRQYLSAAPMKSALDALLNNSKLAWLGNGKWFLLETSVFFMSPVKFSSVLNQLLWDQTRT